MMILVMMMMMMMIVVMMMNIMILMKILMMMNCFNLQFIGVTLDSSRSVVQYGLSTHDLSFSTDGSLDSYKSAGWHGIIHRVLLVELLANTTYYYRVGDPSIDSWSPIYSFTTFYPEQTITFAVIADMDFGVASDGTVKDLTALVENGIVQAVIHSGDISYADGYEPHW